VQIAKSILSGAITVAPVLLIFVVASPTESLATGNGRFCDFKDHRSKKLRLSRNFAENTKIADEI